MLTLLSIIANVILPVFGVVVLAALVGKRLQLQARTLTRAAYYVFAPAFIFLAVSRAQVELGSALQMFAFMGLVHLLAGLAAGGLAWLLRRPREVIAAFVMIACFGNTGNYGLAVVTFHLGESAVGPTTIYFVASSLFAFIYTVGIAGWARGGGMGAVVNVVRTPVLWGCLAAFAVSALDVHVPVMVSRMIGILADAMIPVMLFALGLQLFEQGRIRLSGQLAWATGCRLLLAPLIGMVLAPLFSLGDMERVAGILQSAMPVAIMVAIIAKEHDIVPEFVTSVVVVSTICSVLSLALLMLLL